MNGETATIGPAERRFMWSVVAAQVLVKLKAALLEMGP
jgi:hypothetical protein